MPKPIIKRFSPRCSQTVARGTGTFSMFICMHQQNFQPKILGINLFPLIFCSFFIYLLDLRVTQRLWLKSLIYKIKKFINEAITVLFTGKKRKKNFPSIDGRMDAFI